MRKITFNELPLQIHGIIPEPMQALIMRIDSTRSPGLDTPYDKNTIYRIFYKKGGAFSCSICHHWRWDTDSLKFFLADTISTTPPANIKKRICEAFYRVWDVIGGDIQDSLREQARMGDKDAKRTLQKGTLSASEAYSICVDYFSTYASDPVAEAAWDLWHTADYTGSRNYVVRSDQLKGIGF